MTHVSIIGTGNMGQAIAAVAANGGNSVELFGSADQDRPITGDVVVLAVPYPALQQVLAERADQLAGKVVVDITNPLNFETFDSLVVPADGSAAAELAAKLPDAKAALIAAITSSGLGAVDAGSLERAHELEAIGFLQLTLAVGEQIGWTGGLAVAR